MTDYFHPNLGHAVKLGKLAPKFPAGVAKLSTITDQLAPAPAFLSYGSKVARWPMMLNDHEGDCTCAAVGHMEMVWTSEVGDLWTPTDQEVQNLYDATGVGDTGRAEVDVLNNWQQDGFGLTPHKIAGFAQVNPTNVAEVRQAAWLFGGIYIGVALPLTAQGAPVWAVSGSGSEAEPGSWGGHAVNVIGYSSAGLTVITWGMKLNMTWGFWNTYVDEAWAVLSPDWLNSDKSPGGLTLEQLQTDLNLV